MQVREEESGPRAAIILSQQDFKPSGSSTGRPSACLHSLRHTRQLFLLLLSCFPLRSPRSATSYLMMPPPLWGVEQRSLPGGSPPNLQASSIEATLKLSDQHRCSNWSFNMLCDKERKRRFFFEPSPDDQTKKKTIYTQNLWLTSGFTILFLSFTHTHTHTLSLFVQQGNTHMHRERERQRNGKTHKVICLAAFFFCLSCGAGEQQCSLLLYARTHYMQAHTIFLTASAHTQTMKINN